MPLEALWCVSSTVASARGLVHSTCQVEESPARPFPLPRGTILEVYVTDRECILDARPSPLDLDPLHTVTEFVTSGWVGDEKEEEGLRGRVGGGMKWKVGR